MLARWNPDRAMYIRKATFRHRNDFHFVAMCRSCGKESRWGDGYADTYYQTQVFPARHCPHCGVNEHGERHAIKGA
jgi:hypothetical protein